MTLEYWWSKRNNRRAAQIPDLKTPFDVEATLAGTPEVRLAACIAHANRYLTVATMRATQKRAWLAAHRGD